MTSPRPYQRVVTVFGGSGFLGAHIVQALAQRDWRIKVAVRRPNLASYLQPLGGVGQIQPVQANIRYPETIEKSVEGSDAIINLVGVLSSSGAQTFEALHVTAAENIAKAAARRKLPLLHLSALGADETSPSLYARTKARGEARVRAQVGNVTIFRPSLVFGPEDNFFNLFAGLARLSPVLPLIGGGDTKFQPVFVGDIAAAAAQMLENPQPTGGVYELGGPEIRSFRELMQYILQITGRRRLLLPIPFRAAKIPAFFLQYLPNPLLTPDQVELLKRDSIVSPQAIQQQRTLHGLGITPKTMEAIVPSYLWRFSRTGEFSPQSV